MQYQDTYCSGARVAALEDDLVCLWPSNAVDDIIRRQLASILLEDPDHRLRVAHLEPLLQLSLGQHTPCSSGRLQALLTDPTTAKYFPVDFNVQVADWRSRVVYLDMALLLQSLSAAKHQHLQQQQQAGAAASDRDNAAHMQRGSSNGCSTAAALESHLLVPDDTASSGTEPSQHQQRAASSNGSHRPAPLVLGSIFGSNPAFGRASSVGGSVCSAAGAQHHSQSVPCPAGNSSAGAAGAPPSSLFGGSFEVPYAIASCWADPHSSFDSGVVKHQALETLTAADGCGSSSMASGSSAHSFAAAQNAAGTAGGASAAATRPVTGGSRLRNASTCVQDGTTEPAAANSIDVCTPRSGIAAPGAIDRSPLHSGECEEDAEYSEAQLVFGSINAAAGSNALAATAAATTGLADDDRSVQGGTGPREETSPASGGAEGAAALEAQGSFNMQGVDWSCMATLQQQQAEAAYNQQRSQSHAQQPLLFGLDDFAAEGLTPRSSSGGGGAGTTPSAAAAAARARSSALAAAATGALTARRLLMEHAGLREDCSTISSALLGGSHSPHHLAALAGSLGAIGAGSAPATLQQQQQHEQQLLLAAAAAVGSSGGFGGYGGSFNSAAGAERLLLDADGMSYGLSGSQQHMAALGSLQGTSYSSGGLLSERSGSGFWASPAAMQQQFLLQHHQQQQRQQAVAAAAVAAAAAAAQSQQQQQQMRGSLGGGDGAVDVGVRSDQLLKDNSAGSMGRNGATPGKTANGVGSQPAGALGGGQGGHGGQTHHDLAAERSTGGGSGATGSALTPRLTGWASIAAKEPPASAGLQQQQVVVASAGSGTQGGVKQPQQQGAVDGTLGKAVAKLPSRVKVEVQNLVTQFQGVLKLEDFDDGVVHQLNAKRTEDEAIAAVRHIAHYELGTIQHMAAYLNHLVKHYNHNAAAAAAAAAAADSSAGLSNALAAAAVAAVAANSAAAHGGSTAAMQQLLGAGMLGGNGTLGSTIGSSRVSAGGGVGGGGVAGLGAYGGQIRLASVPVSTKAMLQKLPLKVFKQIELLVQNCAYLEWRHFDAGVIKVLSQLSKLCEGDVFDELELLAATDLSNVEYMPAYLNKRLNNKLWSRRKAEGHVPN